MMPPLAAAPDRVFRTLFSLIFLVAGLGHIVRPTQIVARLEAARIGAWVSSVFPSEVLVLSTGMALVVGGAGLLLNIKSRWAAVLLIACLVPITLSVQLAPDKVGPLFKNIALLGGLIHFAFRPDDKSLATTPPNSD